MLDAAFFPLLRREKDEIEKGIKIIGQTIDEIKQSV